MKDTILHLIYLGILILMIFSIPVIMRLRSLLADLEKTSTEARELVSRLKSLSEKVEKDVERVDAVLDASKDTIQAVSGAVKKIDKSVFAKSAGFFALIPAIKLGWDLVKKIKGGKQKHE